ncbi:hypothetical protein [Acinetobacter baumannii]|uniref:hypothetical protein n=1 Tax=Acinetobacter baumannii TaxID=470 RepID=UPI003BAB85E5
MKEWIGYHNAAKLKKSYYSLGQSVLYTNASGNPQLGDRVWIIEGLGSKTKLYRLVDCFYVKEVIWDNFPTIKDKNKKIIGEESLMKNKLAVSFDSCNQPEQLESLYSYLRHSPSFTGADNKIKALKLLLSLAESKAGF